MSAFTRQVEELVLLKYSLLPDEILEFLFSEEEITNKWNAAVEAQIHGDSNQSSVGSPARFSIKVQSKPLWFEVELQANYPDGTLESCIHVRGINLSRSQQDQWQQTIAKKLGEIPDSEYPIYEVFSTYLLPLLHENIPDESSNDKGAPPEDTHNEPDYHALFTSHHLKSPQKRRSMQQWSSELRLQGFAKVGRPGVIYCWGSKSDVEEFVRRVKDMQWLALRLRFLEELKEMDANPSTHNSWTEIEKIGEVVEEMKKLQREHYVLDLGLGSGGGK